MRRKAPVPFGKGPTEKDPHHGHLAGGLLHSGGGRQEKDRHSRHLARRPTSLIATCGVPTIPIAWVDEVCPGGVILSDVHPGG
ncbi:MAG: hypothetical protein ACRD1G_16230, partial [Acidimicrobiales bacterium]